MARVDWYIEGVEFSNCNCDYACPCQFSHAAPYGDCRGFAAVLIDKATLETWRSTASAQLSFTLGGGTDLRGNGECRAVIDERADGRQRDALAIVLYGGETNEGATHWWVYRMMSSTCIPRSSSPSSST